MTTMHLFLLHIVVGASTVEADSVVGSTALAAWEAPARRNFAVPHPGACAMDVSAGTAELLQVGIGLWSAIQVCKTTSDGKEAKTICIADVAGVVASLTSVGQYILSGIDSCIGRQHIHNTACAQKSLVLAGAISQAAGTATSLSNGCVAANFKPGLSKPAYKGASCVVDIRSAMQSLMTAILEVVHVKGECSISPQRCTEFSAHLIASMAGLARYALSAAADCGASVPPGSACGAEIATLIQSMTTIVAAATGVDKACDPKYAPPTPPPFDTRGIELNTDGTLTMPTDQKLTPDQQATITALQANLSTAQRLFGVKRESLWDDHDPKQTSLSINAILIGLLPVAAIVAFFTGRRSGRTWEYQRPTSTFKVVNGDVSA